MQKIHNNNNKEEKKWMYLSLEGMLCFFWLFLFLFYTQCVYYLWSCFWDVHWLKRICYKRIYYPVYGSLSTTNHGSIWTGHIRTVMFVLSSRKKKCLVSLCLHHSGHSYVKGANCVIFLFLWYQHVYGCKKKKEFMGEIHLLIKKAKLQPNTWVGSYFF